MHDRNSRRRSLFDLLVRGGRVGHGRLKLVIIEIKVFVDTEVLAHVTQRLLGGGELPEMVAPGVVTGAAAGVALAVDGADGSVRLAPGEGLSRHQEGDTFAGLPEAGREFVREQKGVVAPFSA